MLLHHAGYDVAVSHDTATDSYRATLTCPFELIRLGLRAAWDPTPAETIPCPFESNCVGRERDRCVATVIEHQREHERVADHVTELHHG